VTRHPFDLLSLVLGVVAIALAVAALGGWLGSIVNTPATLIAIAVGLVGLLLVASVRPRTRSAPAAPIATIAPLSDEPEG
jgi:hypothetical protein